MVFKLSHIKDSRGTNYLGVKYDESYIEEFLIELLDHVNQDKFDTLTSNQQRRDRGSFHTTVMNVMEYNKSIKKFGMDIFMKKLDGSFSLDINDIEMLGVGTVSKNGNETYFVVIKSEMLDEVRTSFGLDRKDFHITIGFDKKDVFGLPKDETTLI